MYRSARSIPSVSKCRSLCGQQQGRLYLAQTALLANGLHGLQVDAALLPIGFSSLHSLSLLLSAQDWDFPKYICSPRSAHSWDQSQRLFSRSCSEDIDKNSLHFASPEAALFSESEGGYSSRSKNLQLGSVSEQVSKWKKAKGLHFQDSHCNKSLRRLARFQKPIHMLSAQVRAISTCQEIGDLAEMDDAVRKVHSRYKGFGRLPGGIMETNQSLNAKSRCVPTEDVEQLEDETDSSLEEYSQSNGDQSHRNLAAQYDIDASSEDMSDAMDDASDIDSDDDGARIITPSEIFRGVEKNAFNKFSEKEQEKARRKMMDQLVSAALDEPEEVEDGPVREDEQRSLRVGIIGAVNAGKSSLTNFMVGTKVAAVSRKRNTTLSEILGVMTKGKTQILLYDTPGLVLDILGKPSKTDTRHRSESAWQLFSHCEVLLILVDAYRQIHKPDKRVLRLVERLGSDEESHVKKALVFNKVDIVENKKQLLPLAQQFGNLPGYESIFMVSALTGSGVKDIVTYLTDQAILRPWDEEPDPLNEETIRTLSMEVVREHLLDRVHEEIPYELDHQLVEWQELDDGSLRIEQHFYLPKKGQCRIVVGKGGSKIREIGIKACEELRKLLDRKVHLYLEVKHGGGF